MHVRRLRAGERDRLRPALAAERYWRGHAGRLRDVPLPDRPAAPAARQPRRRGRGDHDRRRRARRPAAARAAARARRCRRRCSPRCRCCCTATPGRPTWWSAPPRRTGPAGAGAADRLRGEHAADPRRPVRRPAVHRAARPGHARRSTARVAHQDLPFARIVDAAGRRARPGPLPGLPDLAALPRAGQRRRPRPGVTFRPSRSDLLAQPVRPRPRRRARARTACGSRRPTRPRCSTQATVRRLLGHLEVLLRGVVADPAAPAVRGCPC